MISRDIIKSVDAWLDDLVSEWYKDQPLAQDWARVAKVVEENGEAIQELILFTGQNPRKPVEKEARDRMLKELADTAMTAILAIQHFTKNIDDTERIMHDSQSKIWRRVPATFWSGK
jgi:NTP pyrophosphatase (non-canonical NTP hydrolase)